MSSSSPQLYTVWYIYFDDYYNNSYIDIINITNVGLLSFEEIIIVVQSVKPRCC